MSNIILRKRELKQILKFAGPSFIKVISGIRRSGKSTIMSMLCKHLSENIDASQILYINFEDLDYINVKDASDFSNLITPMLDGVKVIMLDEVQLVENWERVVNGLLSRGVYDIYITGSNSKMLSGELSTLLTGRYVEFKIWPLSYRQIKSHNARVSLDMYIRRGGFPVVNASDFTVEQSTQAVTDIFNSIVYSDIIARYKIRNIDLFDRITAYIINNIGNVFSAKTISDYLKSENRRLTTDSIYEYLSYLEEAFIIMKVKRYDIIGKKSLKINEKFYLADHSFVHIKSSNYNSKIPGILENIVYIELLRRGYTAYVGKNGVREIDFVATKRGETRYIQVSYLMEDDATFEREISALQQINTKSPCLILTMDKSRVGNYDGIICLHLEDWLLGGDSSG